MTNLGGKNPSNSIDVLELRNPFGHIDDATQLIAVKESMTSKLLDVLEFAGVPPGRPRTIVGGRWVATPAGARLWNVINHAGGQPSLTKHPLATRGRFRRKSQSSSRNCLCFLSSVVLYPG